MQRREHGSLKSVGWSSIVNQLRCVTGTLPTLLTRPRRADSRTHGLWLHLEGSELVHDVNEALDAVIILRVVHGAQRRSRE